MNTRASILKLLPLSALLALPFAARGLAREERPLDPDRDLASFVPPRALAYAETRALSALLAQGLDHPFARALDASGLGDLVRVQWKGTPRDLLAMGDALAGFPILPTFAKLTSGGAALAVVPQAGKPGWIALARGEDADLLEETLDHLLELAAAKAGAPGAFQEPSARIHGADAWFLDKTLCLARRGPLFVAASEEKLLRECLGLAEDPEAKGLGGSDRFASGASSRSASALLWSWADLAGLDEAAKRGGSDGGGLAKLRAMAAEPGAQFLLGPSVCAAGRARTITLALELEREDVELRLHAGGVEAGPAAALLPSGDRAAPPPFAGLASERDVASAVLYRDLATLLRSRVELFPPEKLPAFAEGISNFALLFGGADVGESVVPDLGPWVRLVVRRVPFDEGAVPEIPLPAAALLVDLEHPEKSGPELVSAFQTAIGLTNVDRAQRGRDPLRMDLSSAHGASITSARYRQPGPEDGVDLRYNLVPACAVVGRTFVLSTHKRLVEELAAALQKEPRADASGESLWMDGRALAEVVRANREALVMNGVLNEGKPRAQAESETDGLAALLALVESARLRVHHPAQDEIVLEARFDLTGAKE